MILYVYKKTIKWLNYSRFSNNQKNYTNTVKIAEYSTNENSVSTRVAYFI